jgi:hypothetical protein
MYDCRREETYRHYEGKYGGMSRTLYVDEIFVQFCLKPVKGETFTKFKLSSCGNDAVAVPGYEVNVLKEPLIRKILR